jgi:uncharacterized repeat protein (TIGR03803 family)
MRSRRAVPHLATLLLATPFFLTSCAHNASPTGAAVHSAITGKVFGGQQPIAGALLQIYTAEEGTNGGSSTALLSATLTTSDGTSQMNANANPGNANNTLPAGSFTIPAGSYTCSPSATPVYFSASGGNPGDGVNPQLQILAIVGSCASLGPGTDLNINEITTVAAVAALHAYMTAYNAIGATSANYSAMSTAFTTTASEYANIAGGSTPGPSLPSGYYASSSDLIALANSIAACINSIGGSYNDGSSCGKLFFYTKPTSGSAPTDTVAALIDLLNNPTANGNITNIFNLATPQSPFSGASTSAPPDWSLPIIPIPGTPTITPNGGTYTSVQNVTLSDSDATANLYYTTDGTTPTSSSTLYTGPFTVAASETVQAIAIESNRLTSSVASASFTLSGISAPAVSLTPISTTYSSTTGVTITAASNNNGSVVTFGTTSPADGTFSPTTCTIASGVCSVSYIPSGTLAVNTYTNDLTAAFSAYGSYSAGSATSTLIVSASYNLSLLASFTGTSGAAPGQYPYLENLVQGSDGNFYGTTLDGGTNGYGAVFKISPSGTFTLLHSFSTATTDGESPYAGLVQGSDGNFYGTTHTGGANNYGTVFQISPSGTFTLLHSFSTATTDGEYPYAGLVQGSDGNFYGTTYFGGANGAGTVFNVTPSGTCTVLHSFSTATTDGRQAYAGLVQGSDGNFYGTTYLGGANNYGTVFQIAPSGAFTLLHSFSNVQTDGRNPYASLVQGSDGNFYGTTFYGGANGYGTLFNVTPSGTVTVLHSFSTATTDGQQPRASLVQGSDGNFYGTTYLGGANGNGAIFQITPAGTFTLLHSSSTGTTDGDYPYGGLVQGSDGNFYGTTYYGGASSDGAIYKLTPSPALAAPVVLSVPASVSAGSNFILTYAVSNASSTAGVTATGNTTLQSCQYFATNSTGTQVATGALTASTTATNATLTAPATAGTYTYALTCGGMESGFTTLVVQ